MRLFTITGVARSAALGGLALIAATGGVLGQEATPTGDYEGGSVEWTYAGDEGPEFWGDLDATFAACSSGLFQSPVDFLGVAPTDTPGLELPAGSFTPTDVVNNGHTIKVGVPAGIQMALDGEAYELKQLHFHSPAEHTVNGVLYPLEMHLVHQSAEGELAVLGVLVMEGDANPSLAAVFDGLPAEGPAQPLAATMDVADLLPASGATYTYKGSLTTPPCDEGVAWNLFAEPITVTPEQMSAYRDLLPDTARPVQRQLTAEDAATSEAGG